MSIGKQIKHIRCWRGMTQKQLGTLVGFRDTTADVRIAQYETGARKPKENLIRAITKVLEVSPAALSVPNIDGNIELIQTLFALEDKYGIQVTSVADRTCFSFQIPSAEISAELSNFINTWRIEKEKLLKGEISSDEYHSWRYNLYFDSL